MEYLASPARPGAAALAPAARQHQPEPRWHCWVHAQQLTRAWCHRWLRLQFEARLICPVMLQPTTFVKHKYHHKHRDGQDPLVEQQTYAGGGGGVKSFLT